MDKILWIAIALVAGSLLPLQGALNARLDVAGGSLLHAALLSFVVGTVALSFSVRATRQTMSWSGVGSAPWYSWLGGLRGAFSVTAIILTYPRLAAEPKELHIVPNAGHVDLYDRVNLIPSDKLGAFFAQHLTGNSAA
jgi:uncharacterized membrane protein YdcZ (DUF606 family)